jgi:hypothetical protein
MYPVITNFVKGLKWQQIKKHKYKDNYSKKTDAQVVK